MPRVDALVNIHVIHHFPIVKNVVASTDAIGIVTIPDTETDAFGQRFARVPFLKMFPLAPLCFTVRSRWESLPAVCAFIKACRDCRPIQTVAAQPA